MGCREGSPPRRHLLRNPTLSSRPPPECSSSLTVGVRRGAHKAKAVTVLECYVLGGFEVRYGSEPISLPPTVKSRSLLAYLILHRHRPQPRDHLADLFWGNRPQRKARQSLSTALWHIRRAVPSADMLVSTTHTVQVHPQIDVWVDVEEFDRLMQAPPPKRVDARIERLQKAVDLYRGNLLEGYHDDWLMSERYRLEVLFLQALSQLMACYEAQGNAQATLEMGLRLLSLAPLHEEAHRGVMRAYCQLGQRNAALQHYERCRQVIRQELGIEPAQETTNLYQAIQQAREHPTISSPSLPSCTITIPSGSPPLAPAFAGPPDASPFVGRADEMCLLHECWERAAQGEGHSVLISGEPGIGKTRLVEEFGNLVHQQGYRVIKVHCYEYEHALPFAPLADLARALLADTGSDVLPSLSPWQRATLAELVPEIEIENTLRSSWLGYGDQTRLFTTLTELLVKAARRIPLLLIVEDVHWASPIVLTWMHHLARHISSAPLLVLFTYRPNEPTSAPALVALSHQLHQQGVATIIHLKRLTREALRCWMNGLPGSLVDEMYRHTEGNPLFVLETLRALRDDARLCWEDNRWREVQPVDQLPIPDSLRQIVQRRLARTSPSTRSILEVAAVIGNAFDLDVLEQAWGMGTEAVLEALDELLRCHLVREGQDPFARDYVFDHHLTRDLVLEALPSTRCQRLHRRVAQALEDPAIAETTSSAEIAYHYMQARDWERAHRHLVRAGEEADRAAANKEALIYYRTAITTYEHTCGGCWAPLHRARLERRIAECFFRQGEHTRAADHLRLALEWLGYPLPTSPGSLRRGLVLALGRWGFSTIAQRLPFRSAPPRERALPHVEEEVQVYTLLGWIFALLADHEPYLLVCLRALNRSRAAGFGPGMALAATALGFAADFIPLFRVAQHFHHQAFHLVERIREPGIRGFVFQGLAYHAFLLGHLQEAHAYAHQAATAYLHANDPHRWALVMLLMAYVEEYWGHFARVTNLADDILRTGEETGDRWALCVGKEMQGLLERHRGNVEKARAHLQQAFDLAREIPDYMAQVEIGGHLACTLLRAGALHEAVQMVEEQYRVAAEHQVKGDSLARLLNARATIYLGVAEHSEHGQQTKWLGRAKHACRAALKGARAFRPGLVRAMCLWARYQWLQGNSSGARTWWERSLARAEASGQRYDLARTLLEMGQRLDDHPLWERGHGLLSDMGADVKVF